MPKREPDPLIGDVLRKRAVAFFGCLRYTGVLTGAARDDELLAEAQATLEQATLEVARQRHTIHYVAMALPVWLLAEPLRARVRMARWLTGVGYPVFFDSLSSLLARTDARMNYTIDLGQIDLVIGEARRRFPDRPEVDHQREQEILWLVKAALWPRQLTLVEYWPAEGEGVGLLANRGAESTLRPFLPEDFLKSLNEL